MPPSKAAIAPYFTSRLKSAWNSSRRFRVHIAAPPAAIPMQRKVSQAGPWNRRLRSLSSMGCDPPPERSRHREKRSDEAIQSRRPVTDGPRASSCGSLRFARDDGFVTLERLSSRHREFRTGLRPTSLDEIYVTVTFIITSKIKWLSDSFLLLGARRRSDPEPPPVFVIRCSSTPPTRR